MSVVTNNNFAHTGLFASFCIVFILTMMTSGMSLRPVEFDHFFFPFVKLLGDWGEKHGTMIFHSLKLTARPACPQALPKLRHKEALSRPSWQHGKMYPTLLMQTFL